MNIAPASVTIDAASVIGDLRRAEQSYTQAQATLGQMVTPISALRDANLSISHALEGYQQLRPSDERTASDLMNVITVRSPTLVNAATEVFWAGQANSPNNVESARSRFDRTLANVRTTLTTAIALLERA